jgi:hypothetical protein
VSKRTFSLTLSGIILAIGSLLIWAAWPKPETIEFEDSPEPIGSTMANDFWGDGIFGHQPSKIRRVDINYDRKRYHSDKIIYFAKVNLSKSQFDIEYSKWTSDPKYNFHRHDFSPEPLPSYWPAWFPRPSSETYLGSVTFIWDCEAYQPKGSTDVYLTTSSIF